ncbi:MAG: fibronectin type III domain-containing protein [Chitinophagales bacterium]|nr:fibronectin type III domain-containing protein [Chitinophagales bacterium]
MKKVILSLIAILSYISSWALTITTTNVSGTTFCGGDEVKVSYTVDQPANAGNVFTVQLSDKSGGFASPIIIGSKSSTGSGTITCTIPFSTPSGTKYQVRVVSSKPPVIGTPSPKQLKINPKPTGLNVVGVTACEATLTWNAVSTATSYKVQYKPSGSSTWSGTIDVGLATSYTFDGLMASSGFDFRVRTECGSGAKSDWAQTSATTTACPKPTGLIVTDITITTTTLDWANAPCSEGYLVQYRPFGTTDWLTSTSSSSTILLTGLYSATFYEAQVSNNCGANSSQWTASVMWETEYFRVADDNNMLSIINIFPNPSNGNFTVKYNNANGLSDVEITVQNVFGQTILHTIKEVQEGLNEEKVSLSGSSAGLYYVTIKSGDKTIKSPLMVE